MIYITFKDGSYREWKEEKYTDYMVNGNLFIIIYDSQWVGIYNLDSVKEIIVER